MRNVRIEINDDQTGETNYLYLTFAELSALVGAYHVIVMLSHTVGVAIIGGNGDTIHEVLQGITEAVPDLDNLGKRLFDYADDRGWNHEGI